MTAARLDLGADRRTPFVRTIRFEGYDLTGATFKAQVRPYSDAPGSPLVDLATVVSSSAEGLKLLTVETVAGQPVSTVQMRVNQSTMEAMPAANAPGGDVTLAWDLHITIGSAKERWLFGDFVVLGGVTR